MTAQLAVSQVKELEMSIASSGFSWDFSVAKDSRVFRVSLGIDTVIGLSGLGFVRDVAQTAKLSTSVPSVLSRS